MPLKKHVLTLRKIRVWFIVQNDWCMWWHQMICTPHQSSLFYIVSNWDVPIWGECHVRVKWRCDGVEDNNKFPEHPVQVYYKDGLVAGHVVRVLHAIQKLETGENKQHRILPRVDIRRTRCTLYVWSCWKLCELKTTVWETHLWQTRNLACIAHLGFDVVEKFLVGFEAPE